jgi:hypothetical protein
MSDDPAIPDEFPADDPGGEPEIDDQPLGVPDDAEDVGTDQPGLPETEPPADG